MRLTAEEKAVVLQASAHSIAEPTLQRLGSEWAVIGRWVDDDGRTTRLWVGRLITRVDTDSLIRASYWHTAETILPLRRDVLAALVAEISRNPCHAETGSDV